MLFPTAVFALFFGVVFVIHWTLVRLVPRLVPAFLLAASLVFYGFCSWTFCIALVFVGLCAWAIGLKVKGGNNRAWLWGGIAGALLWIFWFKYTNFMLREVSGTLEWLGLGTPPALEIILPVGVSFYAFQTISYLLDVHRGDARASHAPVDVLFYLTFFPHIAAGPIVRAAHFLPQVATVPDAARIPVVMASILILGGLFKKIVIATELATGLVDPVFRDPTAYGVTDILIAAYGYTVQIWCDFSAYSDIAIGVAALLGYHFPKNFDQPFRSTSLSEFWRRWHISLSTWLRDYLYKPLGGSRHGESRTARNLFLTMLLGGIWHGANWTFVLWGAIHGAALVLERYLLGWRERPHSIGARMLRWLVTFHVVVIAFVLFRAPDMATVMAMVEALAADTLQTEEVITARLLGLLVLGLGLHFLPGDLRERIERRIAGLHPLALGMLGGVALLAIMLAGPKGVAPFIYFQF